MLVHEPRLERCGAVIERGRQLRGCDGRCVDTEPSLVGVELDAAEPARVVDAKITAVVEADDEPVPRRFSLPARVLEVVDARALVEHEPARHPETQPEHRAVVHVEEQQLPDAASADELPADERISAIPAVSPRFRNHASGASTSSTTRPSASSANRR